MWGNAELSLHHERDSAVSVLMPDSFVCAASVQQTEYRFEKNKQLTFLTPEQSAKLTFFGLIKTQQHILKAQTGRIRLTNLCIDFVFVSRGRLYHSSRVLL